LWGRPELNVCIVYGVNTGISFKQENAIQARRMAGVLITDCTTPSLTEPQLASLN